MIYPELVQRKNELLQLYNTDKKEFEYQLALWTVDTEIIWNNFEIQSMPIKPQMVKEFEMLPPMQRLTVKKSFWDEHEVKLYYDQKDTVTNRNNTLRKFLEQCLKALPIEDTERRGKVTDKIFEFKERGF